jgi:hypothetical protein
MFHVLRRLLLASVLATGGALAARADVILTFNQTGPIMEIPFGHPDSPPVPRSQGLVELSLVFSDGAFASGVDWNQSWRVGPTSSLLDGLVQIYLRVSGVTDPFSVNLSDFGPPADFLIDRASRIAITTEPRGLPVGSVFYLFAGLTQVLFQFDGTNAVSGFLAGDGSCNGAYVTPRTGPCTFNGTLVRSVPEPASILMLGIGLLALAGARRLKA